MKLVKVVGEKNGWKIHEDNEGGFWVMSCCGNFGGFTMNRKLAEELLMEKSGAIEEGYPEVKESEVKVVRGEPIFEDAVYWHRHDRFFLNGKLIGTVQVRNQAQPRVITKVGDWAVIGYDLRWMLRQNKFRLAVS